MVWLPFMGRGAIITTRRPERKPAAPAVVLDHDRAMRIAHQHEVRELVEEVVKRGRESA